MDDNVPPKIHLGVEDAKFLKTQLLHAANDKIDRGLPVASSDPLRARVESIVSTFINDGFEMARHSMNIDGTDMSGVASLKQVLNGSSDQETEPFDVELNATLRKLYAQVDRLTLQVIELRRKVPDEAKQMYSDEGRLREEALQAVIERARTLNSHDIDYNMDANIKDSIKLEFEQIIQELARLSKEFPGPFEQLDKLRQTIEDIHKFY